MSLDDVDLHVCHLPPNKNATRFNGTSTLKKHSQCLCYHLFFSQFRQRSATGNHFLLEDGHIWLPEAEIFPSQLGESEELNVKSRKPRRAALL